MILKKLFKSEKKTIKNLPYKNFAVDYYNEKILEQLDAFEFKHPNKKQWLSHEIFQLFRLRLSTGKVEFLEKLYDVCEDGFTRKLVARKIYLLRRDYLSSHKEYSDRRLIMFAERENFADRWEGIYLLGTFGKDKAYQFLAKRLEVENDISLKCAIQAAMIRIKKNAEKKKKERGF